MIPTWLTIHRSFFTTSMINQIVTSFVNQESISPTILCNFFLVEGSFYALKLTPARGLFHQLCAQKQNKKLFVNVIWSKEHIYGEWHTNFNKWHSKLSLKFSASVVELLVKLNGVFFAER